MNYIYRSGELYHYGVKGMKWGVRRWQNEDGSLTPEGKRRYKKEYRDDNKKAFELGRDATIKSHAAYIATKKAQAASDKYAKTQTEKDLRKKELKEAAANRLRSESVAAEARAFKHVDELVRKYGNEAVSPIVYDKKGRVHESVETGKQMVAHTLVSAGVTAVSALIALQSGGSSFVVAVPLANTAQREGSSLYKKVIADEKKQRRINE